MLRNIRCVVLFLLACGGEPTPAPTTAPAANPAPAAAPSVRERVIAALAEDDLATAQALLEGSQDPELAPISEALDRMTMGAILPSYTGTLPLTQAVSAPGPAWLRVSGADQGGAALQPGDRVVVLEVQGEQAKVTAPREGEGLAFAPVAFGGLRQEALVNGLRGMVGTTCEANPDLAILLDCCPTRGAACDPSQPSFDLPLSALDAQAPDAGSLLARASGADPKLARDALHAALAVGGLDAEQAGRAYALALELGAWDLLPSAAEARDAHAGEEEATGEAPLPELELSMGCDPQTSPAKARQLPGPTLPLAEGASLAVEPGTCLGLPTLSSGCAPVKTDWMDDVPPPEGWEDEQIRKHEAALAAWKVQDAAARATLGELRGRLGPPILRVHVPGGAAPEGSLLLVYSWRGALRGSCEQIEGAAREDLQLMPLALGKGGTLSLIDPGFTLWLELPSEDRRWGAVIVRDQAEAEAFEALLRAPAPLISTLLGAEEWLALPEGWAARAAEVGPVADPCAVASCG